MHPCGYSEKWKKHLHPPTSYIIHFHILCALFILCFYKLENSVIKNTVCSNILLCNSIACKHRRGSRLLLSTSSVRKSCLLYDLMEREKKTRVRGYCFKHRKLMVYLIQACRYGHSDDTIYKLGMIFNILLFYWCGRRQVISLLVLQYFVFNL